MHRHRASIFLLAGLSLLFAGPFIAWAVVHPPDVNPDDFRPPQAIDNPYLPHPVGRLFVYAGTKEGLSTHDTVCVTGQKEQILDVQATVVHHRSFEGSPPVLVEDTKDFFAQDRFGTVWYFGEDTKELAPDGTVITTKGSWKAGVDDADAGFIMLAHPEKGDRYYQEFARRVAEDQAKVLSVEESVCLTDGTCYSNVLLTQETSRLDPGVVEQKLYAPGVGFVRGVMVKGGNERTELVGIGTCSE